ncbi:MAG: DUF559 domain-containing protein, partial [Hyphomicrobiales bacterium]
MYWCGTESPSIFMPILNGRILCCRSKKQARHCQRNGRRVIWYYLRKKQLGGYKFRRQQPIGNYIVDFACMSSKVVVELDGGQ